MCKYYLFRAPSLKSLRLIACHYIFKFEDEVKNFPLLEELEVSLCTIGDRHVFEAVSKACPELKHFGLNSYCFYSRKGESEHTDDDSEFKYSKDADALGIASMHGLLSLQLFGNDFTNKGLIAILDNCTHLESLDIRHCFNIIMDDALRAKYARIKVLKLPNDSTVDYQFPVLSPVWSNGEYDDYSIDCSDDSVYGEYDDGDDDDY